MTPEKKEDPGRHVNKPTDVHEPSPTRPAHDPVPDRTPDPASADRKRRRAGDATDRSEPL